VYVYKNGRILKINIYSRKQRWKLWLAAFAAIIVMATLWYSGSLVKNISNDERAKAKLWAEAVKRRARLVQETARLFTMIEEDERKKANIWAQAMLSIVQSESEDLTFYASVLESNTTIPVIITYEDGSVWTYRNLEREDPDSVYVQRELERMREGKSPITLTNTEFGEKIVYILYYDDSKIYRKLQEILKDLVDSFISETVINSASVPVIYTDSSQTRIIAKGNIDTLRHNNDLALIEDMRSENEPFAIEINAGERNYIFYKNSYLVRQLRYFPVVQLTIIGLFLIVSYFLFSTSRRAEQNLVWAGMSKETAHQLGTPLSSLSGWVEILKVNGVDESITSEIEKDLERLQTIAERFSKVGSVPEIKPVPVRSTLLETLKYMEPRTGKGISYTFSDQLQSDPAIPLSKPLFSWVIENLTRNAADAMEGKGSIRVEIGETGRRIYIDISDTGKGVPKGMRKQIFQPGFTTKKRGWGLGLSLVKRIIENYHSGKVFVKWSEPGQGTTFRILLPKK